KGGPGPVFRGDHDRGRLAEPFQVPESAGLPFRPRPAAQDGRTGQPGEDAGPGPITVTLVTCHSATLVYVWPGPARRLTAARLQLAPPLLGGRDHLGRRLPPLPVARRVVADEH